MRAHEARALTEAAWRSAIKDSVIPAIMVFVEKAATAGEPGINLRDPTKRDLGNLLDKLSSAEQNLLDIELQNMGYKVTRVAPGNDQRDTGSFLINWNEAMPPRD